MSSAFRTEWLVVALAVIAVRVEAQPPEAASCLALSALEMPELVALDANWIESEPANLVVRAALQAESPLPGYCRVRGRIESTIRFEVWLPAAADWSGRFLALGSASIDGAIRTDALAAGLRGGYAVAATDTGRSGPGLAWLGDDTSLRDIAYRAIYEMTVKALAVTAAFYQQPADYRYFEGCSVGGQQGLMQAERFPELFDGIVAGDPLNAFTAAQATQVWAARTAHPRAGQQLLGPEQLSLLNNAVMTQCDILDGVADGVLEDPRRCNFDPRRLECAAGRTGACLSKAQVDAALAIYAGPSTSLRNAEQEPLNVALPVVELPGFAAGSETGWRFALDAGPPALAQEFFRRAVFDDMNWIWRDFEFGPDYALALDQAGWMLDATSGDLSRFRSQGGKLILYQGWNDTSSPPQATIDYFEQLATRPATRRIPGAAGSDFARLFMVPGMQSCGGGTGTHQFDALRALEDWVERGIAPDRLEASRIADEQLLRTRPLCPYPQTARYRGTGDTDQSGNFVCTN